MSFFNADMEPLVEVYQRETTELLKEYTDCLVLISRDKTLPQERIDAIFRAVHTLKGSAALIGLQAVSACAHRLEDLFLVFRNDAAKAIGNEARLNELLYAFGDYLEAENAAISSPDYKPASNDELMSRIAAELTRFSEPDGASEAAMESPQSSAALQSAKTPDSETVTWRVLFREDCSMENVRAFQLLRQLRPLCGSLSSVPAELEKKNAAAVIRASGLLITLASNRMDELEQILHSSPYILELQNIDERRDAENTAAPRSAEASNAPKYGMVAWDRLLAMQNLVGELITSHTTLNAELEGTPAYRDMEGDLVQNRNLLDQLDQLVNELSMTPVSSIASQYYRLIREISGKEGKHVDFVLTGEELELDRRLLDAMSAPMLHLIRNAVDHGIEAPALRRERGKPETGTVRLAIESVGGNARFTVSDDGGGMDPGEILQKAKECGLLTKPERGYSKSEILSFILAPGFTTTKRANEYSGRGVGMDVVQKTADSLRGVVRIDSEPQRGSAISIEVPVSMSSFECIAFSVGRHACLLPIRNVEKVIAYHDAGDQLRRVGDRLWLERGNLLPVIDLFSLFGEPEDQERRLLVVRGIERSAVLLTGPVQGQRTAVEKPLPPLLSGTFAQKYGVCGCAVIGDRRLALVLNTEFLLKKCPREEAAAGE